jgi:adenosylcobinamide-GDP ribazoletransferase
MPVASFRAAAAAVAFLTRVPAGRAIVVDGADLARGAVLFPLVGAGVGAVSGLAAIAFHERLSSLLAGALAVGISVALTGALHLDALADTADALGAPSRERALEIMRDSRIGTFGAAAVSIDLIVKVAAVTQLLDRAGALAALVAAGALARAVSPPLAATLPYPRVDAGYAGAFSRGVPRSAALGAPLLACGVAVAVTGLDGVVLFGAVALATVTAGFAFRAWLGGATGDCLGAATEVAETFALVVAAALA